MTTPHDGGPAFPGFVDYRDKPSVGMSLRAWFAGQAMVGLVTKDSIYINLNNFTEHDASLLANAAWLLSDAMLKAREGKP